MPFNRAQIIIIAVLLGMVAILVYLNYKTSTPEVKPEPVSLQASGIERFDFDKYLLAFEDSFPPATWEALKSRASQAIRPEARIFELAGLASTWDSLGFKLVSAHFFSKMAARINDENSWFNSGMRFYEVAASSMDTPLIRYASDQAIESFEKVIAFNENNLEAKNVLAICYIQNETALMKGVQLLKDVTRRDSNNVDANYTLGMLSMRSGQFDKAVGRFETLVRIQPANPDFRFYLGDAYAQLGKKDLAIREFERFKTLVPDPEARKNIEVTINQLKNSN